MRREKKPSLDTKDKYDYAKQPINGEHEKSAEEWEKDGNSASTADVEVRLGQGRLGSVPPSDHYVWVTWSR